VAAGLWSTWIIYRYVSLGLRARAAARLALLGTDERQGPRIGRTR